jgi:L-lactate dehydrogenase complex protein LldG
MTERDKILGRIREALIVKAPMPGHAQQAAGKGTTTAGEVPSSHARQWLPRVGNTPEEHLQLFIKTAQDLKAKVIVINEAAQLEMTLKEIASAESWKKVGIHKGELANQAATLLGLPLIRTDTSYDVRDLESCDVGITECDALIAQTGSVLVTTQSAGGRALSVLPPHHIVLASKDQLLPDLPSAFSFIKQKYAANYPSFISFITGPSRTGDIERILVLGAHGPKKLTVVIC